MKADPPTADFLQRFTLENTAIRGAIVRLSNSVQQATAMQEYPVVVRKLLNEFFAATTLLCTKLKFDGRLVLQARTAGQIPLLMAECHSSGNLRGIARGAEQASSTEFGELLADGTLAITIQPDKGEQYQGIVALQGNSLGNCLEHYFVQSEQLPTRFWFTTNAQSVEALMLQVLPEQNSDKNDWEQALHLGDTVRGSEMHELDNDTLLYRLFNSFGVRVHEPEPIAFYCSCSAQRCLTAVHTLGKVEADKLLQEQGKISMDCEFCGRHYEFGRAEINQLFGVGGSDARH